MPHSKQIFFDPDRKRWRRLRLDHRLQRHPGDAAGCAVCSFRHTRIVGSGRRAARSQEALPRAEAHQKRKPPRRVNTHRKTKQPASQVVLNSDEGIRGAFYVQWDAASFASLKEYYPQIDLLFPEWMHVLTADGRLQGVDRVQHAVRRHRSDGQAAADRRKGHVASSRARRRRPKSFLWSTISIPSPTSGILTTAKFLADPAARERFRDELMTFLATDQYKGLTLDIEAFPESSRDDYRHAGAGTLRRSACQGIEAVRRRPRQRQGLRLRQHREDLPTASS